MDGSKISDADIVCVIQEFIKQMLNEGYSAECIGKMCALLIHAMPMTLILNAITLEGGI